MTKGWTNRRVASTNMNRESSRSHSLFTLHLETKSKEEDGVIRTKVMSIAILAKRSTLTRFATKYHSKLTHYKKRLRIDTSNWGLIGSRE